MRNKLQHCFIIYCTIHTCKYVTKMSLKIKNKPFQYVNAMFPYWKYTKSKYIFFNKTDFVYQLYKYK